MHIQLIEASQEITAFVLAGGQSRRMGTDKALLCYRNEPLIQYPIRMCQSFTRDVRIIGDPARYSCFALPVIPDCVDSQGPLSGIYTALKHSPTRHSSIAACDMPLMPGEFFRLMLQKLPGPDAVVMRFRDGAVEPLCGIYSSACLPAIEQNLARGWLKITDLLSQLAVTYIGEEELRQSGLSRKIFTNVNSADDLKRLED
ncbi:MAG: molybdenum cofactor guanylyltransferase [Acidobacteria bacterium]|nr:molybdenum cofactor guanylyltransferase [Acidobacteriota bacterium]MCI0620976.1 molybdenum cofactor guanylyltransferase [Acidobacteriota bacterium]MCI0719890.1 molybdenum cofactor guanylyltransferase [Acidobacteriota bacterium]